MEKVTILNTLIDSLKVLLPLLPTLFGIYKAYIETVKDRTVRFKYEQDELTKREKYKVEEAAMGKTSIVTINERITKLEEDREKDGSKIKRHTLVLEELSVLYEIIDKRASIFIPDHKTKIHEPEV